MLTISWFKLLSEVKHTKVRSFRKSDFTENESSNQETDDKTPGSETDNESSMSSTANSMSKTNEEEKQEKKQIEQGNCYWYF